MLLLGSLENLVEILLIQNDESCALFGFQRLVLDEVVALGVLGQQGGGVFVLDNRAEALAFLVHVGLDEPFESVEPTQLLEVIELNLSKLGYFTLIFCCFRLGALFLLLDLQLFKIVSDA